MKSFRRALESCFGERMNRRRHGHDSLIEDRECEQGDDSETTEQKILLTSDLDKNYSSDDCEEVHCTTSTKIRKPENDKTVSEQVTIKNNTDIEANMLEEIKTQTVNSNPDKNLNIPVGSVKDSPFMSGFGSEFQETVRQALSGPPGEERGSPNGTRLRPRTPEQKKKLMRKLKETGQKKHPDSRLIKDKVSRMQQWVQSFRSLAMDCSRRTDTDDTEEDSVSNDDKTFIDEKDIYYVKPSRIPVPERSLSRDKIQGHAEPITTQPKSNDDVKDISFKNKSQNDTKPSQIVLNCPNYEERRKQILAQLNKKMASLSTQNEENDNKTEEIASPEATVSATQVHCSYKNPIIRSPRLKCGIDKHRSATPKPSPQTYASVTAGKESKHQSRKSDGTPTRIRKQTPVRKSLDVESKQDTPVKIPKNVKNNETTVVKNKQDVVANTKSATGASGSFNVESRKQNRHQRAKSLECSQPKGLSQVNLSKGKHIEAAEVDPTKAIPKFEVNKTGVSVTSGQIWTQAKRGPRQFIPPEKSKTRKVHSSFVPTEIKEERNDLNYAQSNSECVSNSRLEIENIKNIQDNDSPNEKETYFTAGQYEDPRINEFSGFQIYRKPEIAETAQQATKEPKKGRRKKCRKGPPPLINL